MSDVTIYALVDPRSSRVIYIGQSRLPRARLFEHKRTRGTKVRRWIEELAERGLEPRLRVLETVPEAEARAAERRWIDHYRARAPLLNATGGGGGRPQMAEEDRSSRRITVRLYLKDVALLEELRQALGGVSETAVLRSALRALADETKRSV